MRLLLLASAVAVVAVVLVPSTGAKSACRFGKFDYKTQQGVKTMVFCGPATAVVKAFGHTFTFSGGSCTFSDSVSVALGTYSALKVPRWKYFAFVGSLAKTGDTKGSFGVGFYLPGKNYAIVYPHGSVRLSADHSKGTFSGVLYSKLPQLHSLGQMVQGSFSCQGSKF